MESNGQLESAADQMEKLVKSDLINKLRDANEATVRLLIIDEVLRILGWDKREYQPERVTSTGGQYTELCGKSESGILSWNFIFSSKNQEDTHDSCRQP